MIRESLLRKDIRISIFASQVEFDNTAKQPQWGNFLGGVLRNKKEVVVKRLLRGGGGVALVYTGHIWILKSTPRNYLCLYCQSWAEIFTADARVFFPNNPLDL